MSTEIAPLPGNLPSSPLPFGVDNAPGSPAGEMNPLIRLLAAVKRFKWLILITTIVGAGGGVLATRLMPEEYVVSGNIMLEDRGGSTGPVEATGFLEGAQWIELLKDPRVLDRVVRDLRLYVVGPGPLASKGRTGPIGIGALLFEDFDTTPNFVAGTYRISFSSDGQNWEIRNVTQGPVRFSGVVGDSAGREWGLRWVPRPRPSMRGQDYEFTLLTPREVSNDLADDITTRAPGRGGRFVRVSYSSTDPVVARNTLNAVLHRFVQEAATLKRANLVEESAVLDSQLLDAQQRVDASQFALETFKINTAGMAKEDVPIAPGLEMTTSYGYSSFLSLQQQLEALRRERRELGQALDRSLAGELNNDKMMSLPSVQGSPDLQRVITSISTAEAELRELLVRYGPEWKDVEAKRYQIKMLKESTLPLDDDIADVERRVAATETELRQIPRRTLTEQKLTNDLALARSTYADILKRAELTRLQSASSLGDVRILNEAVAPLRPTKNRKAVIVVLGTLAGLGAGLGLAMLLDLLDGRFRYAEQVTGGLGLSILGVIPEIRRAKGKAASAEEAAQVVEAFRTVRLNLSHIFPENGAIALTITSPMPGDGKSLVSSNLALSFAEAGYKTLLIDGDTRRGELHRTFGTDRRPGLLDHLADGVDLEQVLRPTSHSNLTLMPGGSRHRNAPELMGSRPMHELMTIARQRWEVILIDSPPLAAGIDPFVLGTITGNLMMVVRAGATQRDLAEAKLQIIDRLPIRLVGAVLNDVRASMNEYKYYAYSYSYGTTEEDEEPIKLPSSTTKS
ncbi:MAG TPA: polysaccharide biosynthesis tyrosine autokinase [Gemmatimonadales bacterium]|nr:polysaccharide biosynthesis tyrosine autokinase [Gemmatimonadales bacterium]